MKPFGVPSGAICCAHGPAPQMFTLLNYTASSPVCQTCHINHFIHVPCWASSSLLHLHLTQPVMHAGQTPQQPFSVHFIELCFNCGSIWYTYATMHFSPQPVRNTLLSIVVRNSLTSEFSAWRYFQPRQIKHLLLTCLYNTPVTLGVPWYKIQFRKCPKEQNKLKWLSSSPSLPHPLASCSIVSRHKALEGLSQGSVEYQALQLVSSLEHYGVEWHWARDANGQRMAIGVGPEGIAICKEDFSLVNRYVTPTYTKKSGFVWVMAVLMANQHKFHAYFCLEQYSLCNHFLLPFVCFRISYPVIQIATQSGKSVYLTVTKDTNDSVVLLFKLISNRAASGLYRAITETHAFYRWVLNTLQHLMPAQCLTDTRRIYTVQVHFIRSGFRSSNNFTQSQ